MICSFISFFLGVGDGGETHISPIFKLCKKKKKRFSYERIFFFSFLFNVPVNNFSVMLRRSQLPIPRYYQYLLGSKCLLLKETTHRERKFTSDQAFISFPHNKVLNDHATPILFVHNPQTYQE